MASNKKISELEETQDVSEFYIPGVNENNEVLETKKFNLGNFSDRINQTANSIIGEVSNFSTDRIYYPGQYVIYDNTLYRFTTMHNPGDFVLGEVVETDVYKELETFGKFVNEELFIKVESDDDNLNVENITFHITVKDPDSGSTIREEDITTDANGECTDLIPKGDKYTITVPNREGYYSMGNPTYTAEQIRREVIFTYHQQEDKQHSITLNFNTYNGGSQTVFEGLTCSLFNSGQSVFDTQTIANNRATFSGLSRGETYTTGIPTVSANYSTPDNATFVLYDDSYLTFNYKYNSSTTYGLFLVDNNFNEYSIKDQYIIHETWSSGTVPAGYTVVGTVIGVGSQSNVKVNKACKFVDGSPLASLVKDNIIAIHVYPETLATRGQDYFVKVADLCTSPGSAAWASSNVNFPDVSTSTSYYNGRRMTYFMAYDARCVLGITSAAAELANKKTFTYQDGIVLTGYMGTRAQMDFIYNSSTSPAGNLTDIYCVLGLLGFTPNYYDRTTWSSSQTNASHAWLWDGTSHYWYNFYKTVSYGVLPFFSR